MHTKTLFWLSFFLLLFFPSLPLLFFAPYLVASFYRFGLLSTLWRALGAALIINFFASAKTFGLLPISYCLAILLLAFHIRYFFVDKWFTLPLMTYLFSFYSSFFYFLLFPLFGLGLCLTPRVLVTEILCAPLWDTLLAGIVVFSTHRRNKVAS
jgi:hypothetical protein